MKYLVVYGTRPELIKLYPVINELRSRGKDVVVYSSRQQSTLLYQTEKVFGFKPDHSSVIIQINYSLCGMWEYVFSGISNEIGMVSPDVVVCQGDTTTAAAGAMAAFMCGVDDIVHIESGVRTRNLAEPFPEEGFRQMISRISHVHFCPTQDAFNNLSEESINKQIFVVGNTELDSVQYILDSTECPKWVKELDFNIVATIHRRESIGDPMKSIAENIGYLGHCGNKIIMTVHSNPAVAKILNECLLSTNVKLIPPVDFSDFVHLLARSRLVITDSGGIQEDCAYLGIPVVVARNVTDRPEAVASGGAVIGGTGRNILDQSIDILNNDERYSIMSRSKCPFGDGNAAKKIVDHLVEIYG